MRHIVIVGAGQAGSLLALGLLDAGYRVTMISERTAEQIRDGRILSNQCVFEPALRHERALGLNHWDGEVPPVIGIAFDAGMPGAPDPFISWVSPLDKPAQSVDQRLKMSFWLTEFAARGGELRHEKATPERLSDYAREADLVLVAAGRGPQFDSVFPRDATRSPYSEPQRGITLHVVSDFRQRDWAKPAGDELHKLLIKLANNGVNVRLVDTDGVEHWNNVGSSSGGSLTRAARSMG